jgi:hypothetical protein
VLPNGAEVLLPVDYPFGSSSGHSSDGLGNGSNSGSEGGYNSGSNGNSGHNSSRDSSHGDFCRSSPLPASFAPYVAVLQRWGRAAAQGPEARAADALQRSRAQALVARELRRTAFFVGREALKQTHRLGGLAALSAEKENRKAAALPPRAAYSVEGAQTAGGAEAAPGCSPLRVWGVLGSDARHALAARSHLANRQEAARDQSAAASAGALLHPADSAL